MEIKKILIIESNRELASSLSLKLSSANYIPYVSYTSNEGLAILKSENPGLIILDLDNPRNDAAYFYDKICDAQRIPKVPIIMLAEEGAEGAIYNEFNVEGVALKPIKLNLLIRQVELIFTKVEKKLRDEQKKRSIINKRIVIVDDNSEELKNLADIISSAGYNVKTAISSDEGVDLITQVLPALALIKLDLEGTTGDLTVLRLQQNPDTKETHYILYSKRSPEGSRSQTIFGHISLKSGIKDILEYTHPKDMLEEINNLFKKFNFWAGIQEA